MLQFLAIGLCKGAVYALIASGMGLIFATTSVLHIAHGAVFVTAGYTFHYLFAIQHWPLAVAAGAAIAAAAVLGLIIERAIYRPIAASPRAVVTISSVGAYVVITNVIAMIAGNDTKIPPPQADQSVALGGGVLLSRLQIAYVVVAAGCLIPYWTFLARTASGKLCRAVADDPELATLMGVNVFAVRGLATALGSALAAAAAILITLDVGVEPQSGFQYMLAGAVACIIGGFGRLVAPSAGALLLGVLQSVVVWAASARWEAAVTFGALIMVLAVRPNGLFRLRTREGAA